MPQRSAVQVRSLQPAADIKSHSFKIFRQKYLGNSRGISVICRKDGATVNARQKKFAELYAQSGNTVQSAIGAGYSENYANANACKLLENVRVSQYIRELTEKAQNERIMSACERQALLSDIARDKHEKTQDRVKAIDTLNKMTGEYTVKVTAEVNTSPKLADVMAQIGGEGLDE